MIRWPGGRRPGSASLDLGPLQIESYLLAGELRGIDEDLLK